MRKSVWNVLYSGALCCLMGTLMNINVARADDIPAPLPELETAVNFTSAPGTVGADCACNSDSCGSAPNSCGCNSCACNDNRRACQRCSKGHRRFRRLLALDRGDYRCCYCRPEPFTRCDVRDTQVFSAQGYGVPVTTPLAPVVCKQFNYGWGLPGARLTHVPQAWQSYRPAAPSRGKDAPAGRPNVYWHTDTMQMGFYHMRAPW